MKRFSIEPTIITVLGIRRASASDSYFQFEAITIQTVPSNALQIRSSHEAVYRHPGQIAVIRSGLSQSQSKSGLDRGVTRGLMRLQCSLWPQSTSRKQRFGGSAAQFPPAGRSQHAKLRHPNPAARCVDALCLSCGQSGRSGLIKFQNRACQQVEKLRFFTWREHF